MKVISHSHKVLCTLISSWLKSHDENTIIPNCSIIITEQSCYANASIEIPDVIGFGCGCSVVIECKTSHADFIADKLKPFRNGTSKGMGEKRYYFCEEGLLNKSEIPKKWGLLTISKNDKIMIKKSADPLCEEVNYMAERNMLLSLFRRREKKENAKRCP